MTEQNTTINIDLLLHNHSTAAVINAAVTSIAKADILPLNAVSAAAIAAASLSLITAKCPLTQLP